MNYADIPGWCDFENIYERAVATAQDGATFVEIGAWLGRSSAFLGSLIQQSGKQIKFYSIDTHLGNGEAAYLQTIAECGGSTFETFVANLKACGVNDIVHPIVRDSVDAARLFLPFSVDFLFIDGGHSYVQVRSDILAWLPKMKSPSVMAGHDIGWSGVRAAVDELLSGYTIDGSSWIFKNG